MRIDILTLFPEMFQGVLGSSILKRAAEPVLIKSDNTTRPPVCSYHLHNIRDYTQNRHAKVDQPPYGGGPGMVIQPQPVYDATLAAEAQQPELPARRIHLTPTGRPWSQKLAEEYATLPRILLIAGHYEAIDQRAIDTLQPDEISIGDYVLSGGELAAMVLIDSIVRLIPGALGHNESAHNDSFSQGAERLLDHPHYTRPPVWNEQPVPDVLLSGNHALIEKWRTQQSLQITQQNRPDLLNPESTTPPPNTKPQ